ncbi:MAG TPA: hypothetical protein VI007_06585 [bacterium]
MTILVVALDGVLVTARKAQRWHVEEALAGESLTSAAADRWQPGRVYAGTEQGLWRSDDEGRSWRPIGEPLAGRHITAVAVAPSDGGGAAAPVYVGTEPSHLFRSMDAGETWEELAGLTALPSSKDWSFPPRPQTHHVRWIEVDPNSPGRLYVAIEAGALVRTPDGGRTWEDRVPGGPFDTHTLASHRGTPDRFYSAAGDGYFETRDAGRSWRRDVKGLNHRYLVGITVAPTDPSTVLVSASSGPWHAYNPKNAETFVYRKAGDSAWTAVSDGLPTAEGTTVMHFAVTDAPEVVYGADNRGVFRSDDTGERWAEIDLPWHRRYQAHGVQALLVLEP